MPIFLCHWTVQEALDMVRKSIIPNSQFMCFMQNIIITYMKYSYYIKLYVIVSNCGNMLLIAGLLLIIFISLESYTL